MTQPTPAEELRAAAHSLLTERDLMQFVAGRNLARWLEAVADEAERHAAQHYSNYQEEITDGHPIETARAILRSVNGGGTPQSDADMANAARRTRH